jgi:hypothetical protein
MTQPIPMGNAGGRRRRWALVALALVAVAILVCIGVAWLRGPRQAALLIESRNNIRGINMALHAYHEFQGSFPPGTVPNKDLSVERRLSWQTAILPYFEAVRLYQKIDFMRAWDDPKNHEAVTSKVPLFSNPSVPQQAKDGLQATHYVGLAGVGADGPTLPVNSPRAGCFAFDRVTRLTDIADGASNTAIISEASTDNGPWAAGGHATIRSLTKQPYFEGPDGLGGAHRGGWFVGFADGRTWFVSEKVDPNVLEAVMTIRGGEAVNEDSIGVLQSSDWAAPVETSQSGSASK